MTLYSLFLCLLLGAAMSDNCGKVVYAGQSGWGNRNKGNEKKTRQILSFTT